MKHSIRAVVSQLRRFALRPLVPCLVAASVCWGAAAQAQEKPTEPSHIAGWVVIPVDEYRVLRAKAYPVEHDPEPPPLDATLTRVDYDLRVAGDLAAGRATLTVDVLKDGWVRVPVPVGLLVREARLDGKPVSLVPGAAGKSATHLSALLSHAGRFELLLDVDVPVASSAGDESLSLPSTESGVTRASVVLPQPGIDLKIGGGLLSEKSETSGETKWLAYARGNEALTFTWRKKTQDHHVELPLRLRGSLTQLTSLAEDSTSIYAEANFEIVQGAAREVRLQLPEKITINQVSGAMVADWEMKNGELAVTFLEPVEHSARFVINGETRLPRDGIIDIPLLRLLNTERDTGGVAVEILGAGEIKDQKAQGLEDADATDLGEMVASRQSPALVAFRARSGEAGATRSLSVNVARYDQQAVLMANVEEARYQVLMSADGKELVQARYAVRNNQRNFVKVTLPAGATVWKPAIAVGKIPRRRRRGRVRCRDSISHESAGVERERPRESNVARARPSNLPHRTIAVLSAAVPRFSGARNISHAGISESSFCGAGTGERRCGGRSNESGSVTCRHSKTVRPAATVRPTAKRREGKEGRHPGSTRHV